MKKVFMFVVAAAILAASIGVANAQQRDVISIVGSSTVYPFSTVVAERFGKAGSFKTPKIESTGTGGGFKLFCGGVGIQHPDIANASRAIKADEFATCKQNGVTEVVEVKIGYDGIVVANAKKGSGLGAHPQGPLPGPGQGGAGPQRRWKARFRTPTRPGRMSIPPCRV